MAETPPSDPSALRVQTDMAKGEDQGKGFEPLDASKRVTANGGESSSGASMPFAGEMERRGEEKLLDERVRERYQREIGDIFDD